MGFLDDLGLLARHVPGDARNALKGLLGDMPLTKALRGESEVSANGLKNALMGMQVGPDAQGSYDAAMQIGPQAMGGLLGKIVYHGSPHKFDKFDASKIGTGEGAQAYGHGVYLADAEGVAKGYADGLSVPEIVSSKGRYNPKTDPMTDPKRQAYNVLTQAFQNQSSNPYGLASKYARENINSPDVLRQVEKHLLDWQDAGAKMEAGGALYKADLPDEWIPKMLDWDKPLSQQKEAAAALDALQAAPELPKGFGAAIAAARTRPNFDGNDLYRELVKVLPNDQVATVLNRAGIPGIRYLDGGSRGNVAVLPKNAFTDEAKKWIELAGGDGQAAIKAFDAANAANGYKNWSMKEADEVRKVIKTSTTPSSYNYVVFPGLEDKVKILERNGVPLSGLLGQ